MSNIANITSGENQFYPTPDDLAGKMLEGLDWERIQTILEPSAGKGDLVRCTVKAGYNRQRRRGEFLDVDCIEIDPYLRQILKYNFSPESIKQQKERLSELNQRVSSILNKAEQAERERLQLRIREFDCAGVHIVHDDFLTYRARKRYHLIIMNPPFKDADRHLLKALELQKYGGSVVCLLNAETLQNPCTNSRKLLRQQLEKYSASIRYVEHAFSKSERKTDVKVAIVRVDIPEVMEESTIYERMSKAEAIGFDEEDSTELAPGDFLERMIREYNIEVEATLEFIREYHRLKPRMRREVNPGKISLGSDPILTLVIERESSYSTFDTNKYLQKVRLKYWSALFHNESFMGKLTSNLREKYLSTVEKMENYEFSQFNIKAVLTEMNAEIIDGVKATILALFDKLTAEHSWYPETNQNIHYYNGWRTNLAHKVGGKAIIPTTGMFSGYSWAKQTFEMRTVYSVISDIEKVFDYLDGGITESVDLMERLKAADEDGITRNIECKYFKIDLFKKGTTHIKFTNPDLVEKLNIYAARNKKWLPPNYGRAAYQDMTQEEKSVIDSFQGEKAYAIVRAMPGYFLAEPGQSVALLPDKGTT